MRLRRGSSPRCRARRRKTLRRYRRTVRSRTDSGIRPPRGGRLPQAWALCQADPDGNGSRRGRELGHIPSLRHSCRLHNQHAEGGRSRIAARRPLLGAPRALHDVGPRSAPATGGQGRNRVGASDWFSGAFSVTAYLVRFAVRGGASPVVAKGYRRLSARHPPRWWAHLVRALRVHPHKHCANYPPQKDRGFARSAHVYVRSKVGIARLGREGYLRISPARRRT